MPYFIVHHSKSTNNFTGWVNFGSPGTFSILITNKHSILTLSFYERRNKYFNFVFGFVYKPPPKNNNFHLYVVYAWKSDNCGAKTFHI